MVTCSVFKDTRLKPIALIFALAAIASSHKAFGVVEAEALRRDRQLLVEAKELTRSAVLDIKSAFPSESKEYANARALYRIAQSKQHSWMALVNEAIRVGSYDDLRSDTTYRGLSAATIQASQEFLKYTSQITGQAKTLSVLIASIAEAGVKIWSGLRAEKRKDREEYAAVIIKDLLWDRWEEIK